MPIGKHLIGCLSKFIVIPGQRGIDHGQFMGIGTDGLKVMTFGNHAIGGADKFLAQPLAHGLNRPVLPEMAMPATGAKIRDPEMIDLLQNFDLFPKLRHGPRIKHLNFKPLHLMQDRAAAQLHKDRERRDFPEHYLRPAALKCQLILIAHTLQMIGRQAHCLKPLHEIRAEHLALAVECIAPQPGAFAATKAERSHVVQLFAQLAFVNQLCQWDMRGPVDQGKNNARVRPVSKHALTHQKLVKIRVDEGPDNRVNLPLMGPDAGCDIDHGSSPSCWLRL